MITTLAGELMQQNNADNNLHDFYSNATRSFPQYRALIYDYVEVLLNERNFTQALKLLSGRINDYPNDPRLYELQARTYDGLNRPQEAHHALAYNYILHGNLYGAIDQLELAKAAGDNYYELSTIETELKQFRAIAGVQRKKK